jgi:hypothetical protein
MKIRRRLGFLAIAVSALLAAGLLFSAPAFAWHSELKNVSASCPPGPEQPRVDFTLKFDSARSGHVQAAFQVGDGEPQQVDEDFTFSNVDEATFHFLVDNPSEDTTITVTVATFFDDLPEGEDQPAPETATADLSKCQKEESSTTQSTTATTVAPTTTVEAPSTEAPNTTAAAAKPEAQLAGTGSNSTLPMLIVGLVMLVGGAAALFTARIRGRHAK